tara:strand:- start:208 stop:429 length:222 start_codon:yes stop_codon:yes gene_type:complete
MINKQTQQQRNIMINFIMTYASDEIQTIDDALKLATMSDKELLKEVQNIKEYYKREFDYIPKLDKTDYRANIM